MIFICLVVLVLLAFGGWVCRDLLWLDAMPEIHPVHYVKPPRKKVVHKEIVSPQVVKTENVETDTSTDIPLSFEPEVQIKEIISTPDVPETTVSEPVEQEQDDKASLSVGSVRFRKTESGDAFLLEGVLKNTTQNAVELPEKVYAVAYGAEGSVLFKKEIYLPRGVIQPGMEQAFFGTYAPIIKGVQWIDVVLKD